MQTKNYTVFNFDFQTLKIPNDRPDLIESANNLIEFAKIEVDTLKVKKSEFDIMNYAGIVKTNVDNDIKKIKFENNDYRKKLGLENA